MAKPRVGQIGLGNMGGNVARCLLEAGFEVVGYDVDTEAVDAFEASGGEVAGSNAGVAASVDVLLSALNYPEIVEEVYLGEDGVVDGAREGLICIEQSTVPPGSTRRLAADLASLDIDLLDAPFLGGPTHCREGTLLLPVGGEQSVYEEERVQAVLGAMARETHYVGAVGTGKAIKLVNNCISLGNTVLALEAVALGVAHGLEAETIFDALKFAGATSFMFRLHMPSVMNRDFEPRFPVKSTQKDLRYALRAGEEVDFPMHVTSTILQLYTTAAAMGLADENTPAVVKVFEEWIGQEVASADRVDPFGTDPLFAD